MNRAQAVIACVLILFAHGVCLGGTVVCYRESIAGFEFQREVAVLLLGSATSDVNGCKLYFTVVKDFLYVHSNYVPSGYTVTVKLATDEEVDLDTIVYNVLFREPGDWSVVTIKQAIADKIHFYVDKQALEQSHFAKLDFSTCKHIVWDPPRPREVDIIRRLPNLSQEVLLPGNQPFNRGIVSASAPGKSQPPTQRIKTNVYLSPPEIPLGDLSQTENSMKTIFEIATQISTPLALAGFFAAVFFFIVQKIISLRIFPEFSARLGSDILKLVIERLFILSLVAMILGFLGFVLIRVFPSKATGAEPKTPSRANTNAVLPTSDPVVLPIEVRIGKADDAATVYLNGEKIIESRDGLDWKQVPASLLHWGDNDLQIDVYNKASTRGVFGQREGWAYSITIRANGKELNVSDGDDKPGADRWGQTFTAKRGKLEIDKGKREIFLK